MDREDFGNMHTVPYYDTLTEKAIQRLENGENILVLPKPDKIGESEWKKLLESGASINLDSVADFRPISMFVPNFFNNHKCSNLFEAKVLQGKVLVCSLNFDSEKCKKIEVRYLKQAMLEYFTSADFEPNQRLEVEELQGFFRTEASK